MSSEDKDTMVNILIGLVGGILLGIGFTDMYYKHVEYTKEPQDYHFISASSRAIENSTDILIKQSEVLGNSDSFHYYNEQYMYFVGKRDAYWNAWEAMYYNDKSYLK